MSNPTLKDLILARLSFIRRDLDEVIGRLSDDMIKWAPGEGVRPIGDQLLEIGMNEVMAVALLRDGIKLTHAEAEATLVYDSTVATLSKMLAAVRQSTIAYIEALTEEQIAEVVLVNNPWYASFGLPAVPRYDALTSIALHEHYHVGQLITSLWVKGDDPYLW